MNKKIWLKVLIIILIILIIVISVILYLLNKNNKDIKQNDETNEIIRDDSEVENVIEDINSNLEIVKDRNNFYTVADCIQNYENYLVDKDANILFNLLDKEYKERLGITQENVLSKIETNDTYKVFRPKRMYQIEEDESNIKYFVYGTIRDEQNVREISVSERNETGIYITVKLNTSDSTYTVYPDGYMDEKDIQKDVNLNDINFKVKKYINYINNCEVILDTNKEKIDFNNFDFELMYNDNEDESQEGILEKDNENSNGEVKIVFKNDFMIPYKINIKDKNTGTTTEIQLNDTVNSNNKEGE